MFFALLSLLGLVDFYLAMTQVDFLLYLNPSLTYLCICLIFFPLSLVLKKNVLGVAGVISGALLYIRDDFKSVDRQTVLQVT